MSFKPGSFGHRYIASCSPGQHLGPLAMPEFKSTLSSSIESEHESLIKALNGDVASMQDDMCRNYTCCGLALLDLHALVEHFEEAHVVVLDPQSHPDSCSGGGFDIMPMDDIEPDSTPSTPLSYSHSGPSAFDTTSVLAHRGAQHNSFAPYGSQSTSARNSLSESTSDSLRRFHSEYSTLSAAMQSPSACVPPALLFSASATPSPLNTPAASRGASPDPAASASISEPSTPNTPSTPSTPRSAATTTGAPPPLQKPFRCPKPGCNKSYKQANGLKYHMTHGQCNFAPCDPSVEGLSDHEAEKKMKPYLCQVGCNKRFKNMSGLRYHYQHTGEHGKSGLALLHSGHMPACA